jgi:hypothetical protein
MCGFQTSRRGTKLVATFGEDRVSDMDEAFGLRFDPAQIHQFPKNDA